MASEDRPKLVVTTGNDVQGHEILSTWAWSVDCRASHVHLARIACAFKSIVGGNVRAYEEVCEAARQDAFKRMAKQAKEVGADAIIAMRYDATEFQQGTTEVLAYGTAVTLK